MEKLSRRNQILKYIIELFVKTASPIGSKNLISVYNLPFSSATVRNEMHQLENEGFLEKTHTSSGRVPSSKGYEFYIENLIDNKISLDTKNKFKIVLKEKKDQVDEVLKKSCQILSEMTSLTSVMVGHDKLGEKLNKIQLIPVSDSQGVCVLVTDRGHIEHKHFQIGKNTEIEDVEKCINILNERLKETPLHQVVKKMETLRPLLQKYIEQFEILIRTFVEMFKNMSNEDNVYWGTSKLLEKPEYSKNVDDLKKMVSLIEKRNVWKFINHGSKKGRINIQIGGDSELDDISVVSADVKYKGNEGAKIALVGPKRMDYAKVISTLEYLVSQLETDIEEE